jgi:hypothetical protein
MSVSVAAPNRGSGRAQPIGREGISRPASTIRARPENLTARSSCAAPARLYVRGSLLCLEAARPYAREAARAQRDFGGDIIRRFALKSLEKTPPGRRYPSLTPDLTLPRPVRNSSSRC